MVALGARGGVGSFGREQHRPGGGSRLYGGGCAMDDAA